MDDDTQLAAKLAETLASIHRDLVKNKRAALFPLLPRLLATYFLQMHGKQPRTFSNWPCSEVHEGKSALETCIRSNELTSTITHRDLHEDKSSMKGQFSMSGKEEVSRTTHTGPSEEDKSGLKDGASVCIPVDISAGTDMDLPEELEMETNMQEALLGSLEGFFLWLDEEADEGEFKGVIERDPAAWINFLKEFLRQPIGSGILGQPLNQMMCANQTPVRICPFAAADDVACNICTLVKYCSNACVWAHKNIHKQSICDSLLINNFDLSFPLQAKIMDTGRQLAQRIEDHADAEISNPVLPSLSGLLYDWAPSPLAPSVDDEGTSRRSSSDDPADGSTSSSPQNHPRQDVLPDHVRLLFPALYDLRNIFTTVCNIPDNYTGSITFFLNFAQAKLAVRDFLILELLRRHGAVAIDLAIGLWYSAAITATQDTHLMLTIVRMLHTWQSSLSATGNQHSSATYQQPFPSSTKGSSVQADFGMDIWSKLRELVCTDDCNRRGFDPEAQYAWGLNENVQLKVDAFHPTHLASWFGFEKDGLLLPFGAPNWPFNTPNRFRYSPRSDLIARYTNDPVSGWDIRLLGTALPTKVVCVGDLYGLFFFQLREMMEVFVQKTASCCIRLRLMQFETRKLFEILTNSGLKFHRIDACALNLDKEVTPDEAMWWCGGLLDENATPEWPSLLLTATCKDRAEDMHEAYKKGVEIKRNLTSGADHMEFWEAIRPVTLRTYAGLFESEDFPGSSFDDQGQEHVAAQLGLHKQMRHRIVSPIPGVFLEDSWQLTPAQALFDYVDSGHLAYFNLLFSGFTFEERYHEWGWAPGH